MKFLIVFALALVCTNGLSLPKAGIQKHQHEGRIAGGETADIVNFSYQVGLALHESLYTGFWCGGSLIAPNWVLTAAHCTEGIDRITVYLGSGIRANADVEFEIERSADTIIEHEEYNTKIATNDIALIRIPTVKYSRTINPVRLSPASDSSVSFVDQYATLSGWGLMGDHARNVALVLQSVTLRVIPNSQCARTYGSRAVNAGKICLATDDDYVMRSPCEGDSGGPLALKGTNVQIGITSFGNKLGCEKGKPAAFTRVSNYMDWIVKNTGINF